MNTPLTKECIRLSQEACNYEERRTKGKLISRINWFDAVDGRTITARDREGSKLAQPTPKGIEGAKLWQPINDIP